MIRNFINGKIGKIIAFMVITMLLNLLIRKLSYSF